MELDAAVVCVDTWLGSIEHWDGSAPGWDARPLLKHGYPTLYFQFLANVMHQGCSDLIVPIPNTSANAAKLLAGRRVSADLVYIDASHEEEDVYRDLCDDWRPLRPGGVMSRGMFKPTTEPASTQSSPRQTGSLKSQSSGCSRQ